MRNGIKPYKFIVIVLILAFLAMNACCKATAFPLISSTSTLSPNLKIDALSLQYSFRQGQDISENIWDNIAKAKKIIQNLPILGMHGLSHANYVSVMQTGYFIGNVAVVGNEVKKLHPNKFRRVIRNEVKDRMSDGMKKMKDITIARQGDLEELPVILFVSSLNLSNGNWRYPGSLPWQDEGFAPDTMNNKFLGAVEISKNDFKELRAGIKSSLQWQKLYGEKISMTYLLLDKMIELLYKRTLELFVKIARSEKLGTANAAASPGKRRAKKAQAMLLKRGELLPIIEQAI